MQIEKLDLDTIQYREGHGRKINVQCISYTKILCSVPGEYLQRKSPRSRQLLTKQCEAGNEVPSPTFLPIQNMSAFRAPPLLLS